MQNEKQLLEEFGWYAHCVPAGDDTPYGYNYHTHGMEGSYQHRNFQIVVPLNPKIAHGLIHNIVEMIKGGVKFEAGKDYHNIAEGYPVRFIKATECGRNVFRILVPDENGKYEGFYAAQFMKLDNNEGHPDNERAYQED